MASHIEELKTKAQKNPKTIVLPEGNEPRVLEAASRIASSGAARVILIGKEKNINSLAKKSSVTLGDTRIIDPETYPHLEEMVEIFYNRRKHKGVTTRDARKAVLENCVYFGALLVTREEADGFVAGASHTTSNVARAGLYCIGLRDDIKTMSSSFIVEAQNCPYGDGGLFIIGDCGIVPDPNSEQLADIAISTARLYEEFFGHKPRVALLSYSTKGSARGASVDKVLGALECIRKRSPGLQVDGELQFDAAVVPEVAKIKSPASKVAGKANVLIFPNLDSGNISYKMMQRLGNVRVVGPLLQGLKKPGSDLSRGCLVEEIVDTVVATCVRAQAC